MGAEEAEAAKKQGNDAFVAKKYDEAIKFYTEALNADPENKSFCAIIYANRSAANGFKKEWQKAYDDANEALKKDNTYLKAYYRLSVAQCELGQFDEAIEILGMPHFSLLSPSIPTHKVPLKMS
jgi:tetratricopeptide (TPR) repeat protein